MPWWTWPAAIFAAPFLVNGVPHFVHGVSGKKFPTPFSGGAGTLDGPVRNVLWGAANLLAGGWLSYLVWPLMPTGQLMAIMAVTGTLFGAMLGWVFANPDRVGRNRGRIKP